MGSDNNVDLTFNKFRNNAFLIRITSKSAQVIHTAGESFQPLFKGVVVLESQYGGGDQYCHLFAVGDCLESCPYGNFGLAETHIPAYQPIHGKFRFHSTLHICGSLQLIWCIFIYKRRFQFLLQVGVLRKCKSFLILSPGIQQNQLPGNVLYLLFGIVFQFLPCTGPKLIDLGRS